MSCTNYCILNAATANGSSASKESMGGINQVHVSGVMDGATVTIEGSMDGGTLWSPIKAITAIGHYSMPFTRGLVRATISGVGAGTLITLRSYEDPDVQAVF